MPTSAVPSPHGRVRGATARFLAAHGHSERSPIGRADAARRRRVLGHLSRAVAERRHLRQARAGQAQGRGGLARAGRAQPLGGRVDARGGGDRPRRGAGDPRRGRPKPGRSRWPGCRPTAIRSGRRSSREGAATAADAARVGATLGRIHAATADRPDLAARFATDANFHAIRLDPYLLTTARAHPDLAARLQRARRDDGRDEARAGARRLQPEEHPARARGPGDPRRRVRVVRRSGVRSRVRAEPPAAEGRVAAAMAARLRRDVPRAGRRLPRHVQWEPWPAVEARTAALLPGLLLARVDGKSPVEYVTDAARTDAIRAFARPRTCSTRPQRSKRLVKDWAP